MTMIERRPTRQVRIGDVRVGGDAPVVVQSMCDTDTKDVEATVAWYKRVLGMESEIFGEYRHTALKFGRQKFNVRPSGAADWWSVKNDAPGAVKQSAGYGRSTYEETDFHQLEEDRWAHAAAEEVNRRALANDFEALAIVAPPKTLGEIRKKLHKEAERRIVLTVNKEMTDRPIPDIEELLVGEAAPPA